MNKWPMIIAICTLAVFYVLRLTYETPFIKAFDDGAFDLLYGNELVALFHYVGDKVVIWAVTLILCIVIWIRKKDVRLLIFAVLSVAGAYGLYQMLKRLIERPRPEIVDQFSTFSFPSGHALHGLVYLLTIAYVLIQIFEIKSASLIVWIAAIILAILVGLSRIAEARHFASDVVAGWSLGYSWFMLCLWWYKIKTNKCKFS